MGANSDAEERVWPLFSYGHAGRHVIKESRNTVCLVCMSKYVPYVKDYMSLVRRIKNVEKMELCFNFGVL